MANRNNQKTRKGITLNGKQRPIRLQTRTPRPRRNTKIEQYTRKRERDTNTINGPAQCMRRNKQNADVDNPIKERTTSRNNSTRKTGVPRRHSTQKISGGIWRTSRKQCSGLPMICNKCAPLHNLPRRHDVGMRSNEPHGKPPARMTIQKHPEKATNALLTPIQQQSEPESPEIENQEIAQYIEQTQKQYHLEAQKTTYANGRPRTLPI